MVTNIKLKSGTELYVKYVYDSTGKLMEMAPFSFNGEQEVYLKDGDYELYNNTVMVIKDKIIYRVNKK